MKLYVTRHGETAWNVENIVCGTTDLPLNDTGRAQALEWIRQTYHSAPERWQSAPSILDCEPWTAPPEAPNQEAEG